LCFEGADCKYRFGLLDKAESSVLWWAEGEHDILEIGGIEGRSEVSR
jgi:hypothetical protein